MNFNQLIKYLKIRLQKPLPGLEAHIKMASTHRIKWIIDQIDDSNAKESAVLILLYAVNNDIKTVLILRTDYGGVHSGQVSFPGGKYEESDKSLLETALRESYEEIGINIPEVKTIGRLSKLYIPPSNFNVYPYVGYVDRRPGFSPDKSEVERIIEINLSDLIDTENRTTKEIQTKYATVDAPCFVIDGVTIWGATAMIISELLEVIQEIK